MRKIAANYILLPGFEFVKNGYVVLKDGMVVDVVNTGGEITGNSLSRILWGDAC